ncbi:hypothetical protein WG906_18460 [Pedobacter sp. P351]|uniref:hypothetical protein n=1 Tax=Pedobacter superstes TaxID=3133441 RepID=UPI0030B0C411
MKKAAVCMAAFYLLLITGMYACIVSCGSGHIKEFLSSNVFKAKHNETDIKANCIGESEKHCDGEEGCPCCEKHGNYTVKENIKPDSSLELLKIPALAESYGHSISHTLFSIEPTSNAWPNSHAPPPPGISPPIYIKIQSLLI